MEESILEVIKMIKRMDMEFLRGLMEGNMKEIGKMENNMEKDFTPEETDKPKKVLGKTEERKNGNMKDDYFYIN